MTEPKRGMKTSSYNIGSRIKARRKELGLTQASLADRMGIGVKSTISDYENGKAKINAEMIEELTKALNTTAAYLFSETDNPEPAGTGNSLDELIMGEVGMMSDEEKRVFYNMILFNRLNRNVV